MTKVLIWNSFPLKKRNGGPPTYLYNLCVGLKHFNNSKCSVSFLNEMVQENNNNLSRFSTIKPLLSLFPNFINYIRLVKYLVKLNFSSDKIYGLDLNSFDIIHFHISIDVYKNRKHLKDFRGKILVSSHSPQPFWIELIDEIYKLNHKNRMLSLIKNYIEKKDHWSFKKSDYIVFPCPESREPYFKWKSFKKNFYKENKFLYVASGIEKVKFLKDNSKVRSELGIPSDAIVFSYIGRHSKIKGYDMLKKIGEYLFRNNNNIYFLIAGKEYPISGLKHPNWIEVGWTTDPHSYVNASDFFILPNRETYFDLVLLEVLSLGVHIILSDCGGNNYFKKYSDNSDISFFKTDDLKSMSNVINELIEHKKNKSNLTSVNKSIFKLNYSLKPFTKRYLDLYGSINI